MPFSPAPSKLYTHHASTAAPTDIMMNANEFIPDKLYFTSLQREPPTYSNVHFFTIDNTLVYINFYADFGPLNIAHVMRFCTIMNEKLQNPALANKKICLYSSMDRAKRANAAYLMCAYMMLVLKKTPEEAYAPLANASPPFVHFRDAGYGAATYHLSVFDCIQGFYKALQVGLFHIDQFDLEEYEFYEKVENGDMNWITDKFIALATPKDDPPGTQGGFPNQAARQGFTAYTANLLTSGFTAMTGMSRQQKSSMGHTLCSAYRMDDLIKFLKERGVCTIIRLNNNVYDRKRFIEAGIEHVDLYFPDGSTPPDGILKRFLDICESRRGVIAVHCKAGLGRTGSLIGSYLMKHYKMTASEVISFLRVMRPGSVVGPQQNWLESMQTKLWKMHPVTKLSSSISLLRPSSFETSVRFYFPQLETLISSTHPTLRQQETLYSNEDLMSTNSDEHEERESVVSQVEDYYGYHRPRPLTRPTAASRLPPNLAQKSRTNPITMNRQVQLTHTQISSTLYGHDATDLPMEDGTEFDAQPFSLEEYVIPVQPRKGKRNAAAAKAMEQEKRDDGSRQETPLEQQQQHPRYQVYANSAHIMASQTSSTMNGFVLKGVSKTNTPGTVEVKTPGMVPNNAGRVYPSSKK